VQSHTERRPVAQRSGGCPRYVLGFAQEQKDVRGAHTGSLTPPRECTPSESTQEYTGGSTLGVSVRGGSPHRLTHA